MGRKSEEIESVSPDNAPDRQNTRPVGRPRRDDPIAIGLRKLLSDVAEEPVPDSFMALLDKISAARADVDSKSASEILDESISGRTGDKA